MSKKIFIGTKFFGHDSALFVIDTRTKKTFGLSTERVTRIKHDTGDIEPILKEHSQDLKEFLKNSSQIEITHSFINISFSDIRSLLIQRIIRKKFQPKYIKDLIFILEKYNFLTSKKDKIKFIIENISNKEIIDLIKSYLFDLFKIGNPRKKLTSIILNTFRNFLEKDYQINVTFYEHHLSHAAGAYYFSPFNEQEALVFTLDGYGDHKYQTLWKFNKKNYELISFSKLERLPNKNGKYWFETYTSIGGIYSLFTDILGFTPNSDEGKTEALAAYGKPNEELLKLLEEGYILDKENLRWTHNFEILKKLHSRDFLENWKRKIGKENFAATVQRWLEKTVVTYLNEVYKRYRIKRLALAGGVVANVIMNLKIFEQTPFEELYIFPPMGDEGTAAGSAVLRALDSGEDIFWLKKEEMPYWGPRYSQKAIEAELRKAYWQDKISIEYLGNQWPEKAAKMIAEGKVVAVYQGRMEFGPRALGNRSILADPRDPKTRDKINSTVKRRPWFQPFCPSVLEEERERLFEKSYKHKHMAIAFRMKKEFWDKLPSAMHIDGTARPQFVEQKDNPNYYRLLKELKKLTGYGVVVNTSFNLHGRTIVRTPKDALTDFLDCNIDALFMEGFCILRKSTKNNQGDNN